VAKHEVEFPDEQREPEKGWTVTEWEDEFGRNGWFLCHDGVPIWVLHSGDRAEVALTCLRALPPSDRLKALLQVEEVREIVEAAQAILRHGPTHYEGCPCDGLRAALEPWTGVMSRG
jgi:hypothetical protein